MTAYVSKGAKAIVYTGNLTVGGVEALLSALREQGVEVIARLDPGREPAGSPSIVAVVEPPEEHCPMCGYPDEDAVTLDGAIVDEAANWAPIPGKTYTPVVGGPHDCPRDDRHSAHVWAPGGPDTLPNFYCKGVPA